MKNKNTENSDHQPNPKTKTPEVPKKAKKKPVELKKEKQEVNSVQLPVLVEFTYTISILLLILLALTIAVISFLNGASLFTLVLRTGVTIFVMGGLLTFISAQVASGLLFSSKVEQEEYQKKQSEETEIPAGVEALAEAEDLSKTEAA